LQNFRHGAPRGTPSRWCDRWLDRPAPSHAADTQPSARPAWLGSSNSSRNANVRNDQCRVGGTGSMITARCVQDGILSDAPDPGGMIAVNDNWTDGEALRSSAAGPPHTNLQPCLLFVLAWGTGRHHDQELPGKKSARPTSADGPARDVSGRRRPDNIRWSATYCRLTSSQRCREQPQRASWTTMCRTGMRCRGTSPTIRVVSALRLPHSDASSCRWRTADLSPTNQ